MGGKSSAPAAPDYLGAATAQAAASEKATTAQNFANRPTINTPFGSQTWSTGQSVDPATGQDVTTWTQNTSLAPGLQSALDSQIGLQNDRSQLASGFMGRVANEYAQPFDYFNLPQMAGTSATPELSSNVADYTRGLNTDVNSRDNQVVGGFNFGGPQMGVGSMTYGLATGVNPQSVDTNFNSMANGVQSGMQSTPVNTAFNGMTSNIQGSVASSPVNANFSNMNSGIQGSVGNTGVNANFANMNDALRRSTGTENLQRSLTTSDNPALPQFDSNYRNQIADQLMARMDPIHQRQQSSLETQLANQGFRVGSEGYKRALDELNMRQAAERYNALDTAGNEAQRLYNMGMGARQQAFNEDVTGGQFVNSAANQAFNQGLSANQFANQATQQAYNQSLGAQQAANAAAGQQFNQGVTQGQFQNQANQQAFNQAMQATQAGNAALGQQFNQNLAAGQFGNSAIQQAYAQALGAQQAGNAAQGQLFNQNLGAGQFNNAANQQAFNQSLAATQAANAARSQAFGQDVTNANLNNQATGQAFNQVLGAANFGNQAQQQYYNQLMGQANLQNQAAQQQFNQDLASQQFRNQALGQASALDIARMNATNQAAQNQFALNQQAAAFQNQLRQQAIAEQMQRRGMSLNEMNALLSGQQVGMPQMPTFNTAGRAETPQILQATQMGYDAALGNYNAQQAAGANTIGGLFSLGSAALGNPYGLFGLGR